MTRPRCAVGRRLPSAAAAGPAQPGRRPPVGPAVEYWRTVCRCDTKLIPGHPDALGRGRASGRRLPAAGYASEAVHCTSGFWPNAAASSPRAPGHHRGPGQLAKALILAASPPTVTCSSARSASASSSAGPGTRHPQRQGRPRRLLPGRGRRVRGDQMLSRNLTDRERLQGPRDARPWPPGTGWPPPAWSRARLRTRISNYKRVLSDREKCSAGGTRIRSRPPRTSPPPTRLPAGSGRDAVVRAVLCGTPSGSSLGSRGHPRAHGQPGVPVLCRGPCRDAVSLLRNLARAASASCCRDPLTETIRHSLQSIETADPSASAAPVEAGISVFHLLRQTGRYHSRWCLSRAGLPRKPSKVAAAPGGGDGADAHSFPG